MSQDHIFKLPDLGEGLPDAEIREWYVKEGDVVKVDQPLASMETAKALVDLPSPRAGKIKKLYGQAGDIIITGRPLVEFESEASVSTARPDGGTVAGALEVGHEVVAETAVVAGQASLKNLRATPAVRQLAKQLGIDLTQVKGSGPLDMITADDLRAFAGSTKSSESATPLKGLRRQMALSMSQAHAAVVPVTIVDDADVESWFNKDDISVRIIRAIVVACQAEPALNAWFDAESGQRTLHQDVHLGMAVDTEEGLMVPVIKAVQQDIKNPTKVRATINEYKELAKTRRFSAEQLKDATITLSNFGGMAGRYATPIVLPPQVAIVGIGKLRPEVIAVDGEVRIHHILPISLTMDHRAVTGGEAARFLAAMLDDLKKAP